MLTPMNFKCIHKLKYFTDFWVLLLQLSSFFNKTNTWNAFPKELLLFLIMDHNYRHYKTTMMKMTTNKLSTIFLSKREIR